MPQYPTLLIASDCPNTAFVLEIFAREINFRVKIVETTEAALKEIKQSPPDFLLIDADLPPNGGYALCFALKHKGKLPKTIMTGIEVRDIDHKKAEAVGVIAYLPKPFSLNELQTILNTEENSILT